jgi:hypothetical protein
MLFKSINEHGDPPIRNLPITESEKEKYSTKSTTDKEKKEPLNKGRLRKEQEFNFEEMCPNF